MTFESCNVRLSLTEANLSKGFVIFSWKLPPPSLPLLAGFAERVDLTDGGQSLRGWPSCSMTWGGNRRLTGIQARVLYKLVNDALDGAGVLYATVSKGWDGTGNPSDWIDVRGVPQIPQISPVPGTGGALANDITLFLNDLEVINDPATGL